MDNRPDQLRLTSDERADLVAFLDGELPERQSRNLSTKLTQSATARREVEILKQTWELLDYLVRPSAPPQFSERTVTHIRSLELRRHPWEPLLAGWSARVLRTAVCLIVAGVSLLAGYAVVRYAWPDPTSRLVRDLTLAEHLDEYLDVGSFEFLSQLAESKEFGQSSP
jgi:anti-sigma factor RsiW